jgi:hypothetical protein
MNEIFISLLFGPIWNEKKVNSVSKWTEIFGRGISVQILV